MSSFILLAAAVAAAAPGEGLQDMGAMLMERCPLARGARTVGDLTPQQRRSLAACLNRILAQRMNAATPQRVNQSTTLTSVRADGPTMVYTYRVDMLAGELPQSVRASIDGAVRRNACAAPQLRSMFALGGGVSYQYLDRAGAPIQTVSVTRC